MPRNQMTQKFYKKIQDNKVRAQNGLWNLKTCFFGQQRGIRNVTPLNEEEKAQSDLHQKLTSTLIYFRIKPVI